MAEFGAEWAYGDLPSEEKIKEESLKVFCFYRVKVIIIGLSFFGLGLGLAVVVVGGGN